MHDRIQNNLPLYQLISEYESQIDKGNKNFFEDKDFVQLIDFYASEMDYSKALEAVNNAIEQYKYHSEFYALKTRLLIRLDEIEEAKETLRIGKNIDPSELEFEIIEIQLLQKSGKTAEAEYRLYDLFQHVRGSDRVQLLLCKAGIEEQSKDFEAMFITLSKALRLDPTNIRALEKIWVCVELCKNYKSSIKLHKELIDRQPYNFHAWYNLGHAYSCIGEYELAIMSLEYSFLINEDFEIGYKDCAEMCYQVQRYEQSLDVYLQALEYFGPDHELLVSIGQCYLELDKITTARLYLRKASRIDPYDDETYYLLGRCALICEEWGTAIKQFQKAITIEDRREEYYAGLANAYYQTGNHTSADYYYRKATETGPEQVEYWVEHLSFLIDLKAYDLALEVLEEAEYHTYGTELLYCKSALYLLVGKKAKGMSFLTEGIEEDASKLPQFFKLYNYEHDQAVKSLISYYV